MVYCFLANGFEEIEALATIDILRRAEIDVKTVAIGENAVKGRHDMIITADINEKDLILDSSLEAVMLPGGLPGTINLENSKTVQNAVDYAFQNGKYLCAICAAPLILGHKNLLKGKNATCYPGFEKDLYGANPTGDFVTVDANFITGKGAGVAIDFALEIVAVLKDRILSDSIKASIQSK